MEEEGKNPLQNVLKEGEVYAIHTKNGYHYVGFVEFVSDCFFRVMHPTDPGKEVILSVDEIECIKPFSFKEKKGRCRNGK